ncbi:MAG: DUF3427 domain-containing protein [Oscillospiraceae bacterium]|nr:DUF3427 domain-containing protein [Oscillospiraceae bacterium]
MLIPGLYEQVINKALEKELSSSSELLCEKQAIDGAEAPSVLAKYIAEIIEKGLRQVSGEDMSEQIDLANRIVSAVAEATGDDEFDGMSVDQRAEQLLAVAQKQNSMSALTGKIDIPRPETSLAASSLFTGAIHEPSMMDELRKEICSADRIDMLVSFVKWSGLRLIINELVDFTQRGGKLRVITTSYMGATDARAVEELRKLTNTEIKISYDTARTRLHAKAYVFYRDTGFTTAYVGSSNMSNAAMTSGLEWNLKITAHDQPATLTKISATFESYWNSKEFTVYSEGEVHKLEQALKAEKYTGSTDDTYGFDINPYPYQQEILDRLKAEREIRGKNRNLVVAATGTGKTVISAFDYKRFCRDNAEKPCRLLFVAHREEILRQSLKCFRGVLHNADFGELFVGNHTPSSLDNLFVSVQTLNSRSLTDVTSPDFYDFIIVDEFHHAAAPTYQQLLEYYQPKILLGLTATPERMDGKNVLEYFDNRIAAEIRLPEAIDRKLLCPFHYFGVADDVDLSDIKWSRGGYERSALSKVYTGNDMRVMLILKQLRRCVTDIDSTKGLGFCVSKEHAEYMSRKFNEAGIASEYLTSDSRDDQRRTVSKRLASGEIHFVFTVDLFNEGVDIPEVNTIIFLRPTESLTVFLQQLGRGLRLAEGKECLTVLDFIGQAHKKYNFEEKFAALLSNTARSVQSEIKNGFISLPKGCYFRLERQAQEYILDNIKRAMGNKAAIINRIATFTEDTGLELTLNNFLSYYHLDISAVYATKTSFARLCASAGVIPGFDESIEDAVTKALPRICAIDSRRWIEFIVDYLPKIGELSEADFTDKQLRMLTMLQFTIWQKTWEDCGFADMLEGFRMLAASPIMLNEVLDILYYNYDRIDFVDEPVDLGFECPLDVHCTYSRDQILTALDFLKPNTVREGVKYLPEKKVDVLFVTLNKSEKQYSPTTMYEDYSIDENLFHWQSQSTVSPESNTGQRYINHRITGDRMLLFVREFKQNKLGASPYTFLGLADYVSSTGSKPMNVIWKLHKPIPAKYLKKTNKLIVG